MEYYVGIDLHGNNNVIVIADILNRVERRKRLPNDIYEVLNFLEPYKDDIVKVAVESTFNWYWLVDGLQEAGYNVLLANPAAMVQYRGLKYSDDNTDAQWIARMLALDILPTGYIFPKEDRAVRDLLRKRMQLVRLRTTNILSINTIFSRNTGKSISGNAIKKLSIEDLYQQFDNESISLAAASNLNIINCIEQQIKAIEKKVRESAKLKPSYSNLMTIDGIGDILSMTISLETGDISRFKKPGDYSSYCRCVKSERISNNKKKGTGNRKNGNKFLAWALIEAATFVIRFNKDAERFYQRKKAKGNQAIAKKAVANKLAKACFYIMRDNVKFDNNKCFAP